ncbi:MAG: trans-aconitate 2-methyltransferase [Gammaproteobacteria bacterium]
MSDDHWSPQRYADNARFVSDLGHSVVTLLAPRAGERILDLGCGDGALTRTLMQAGCSVVGVDASPAMVAAARDLGVDARVVNGADLRFDAQFDAVFSNAALHWMKAPERVVDGVWRALVPGGRFVAECGGYGNVASIVEALDAALAARGLRAQCPWYFPRPDEYAALLRARGFAPGTMDLFPRPTPLPGDVGGWLDTFARDYTAVLPPDTRAGFVAEVVERLRPRLCGADGAWIADYVRLRFSAVKPRP